MISVCKSYHEGGSRGHLMFLVTHSGSGGVQELWSDLAQALRQRGFECSLVALYPHRSSTGSQISWRHLAPMKPSGIWRIVALLVGLIKLLRQSRPTLIVSAMPAANVVAAAAALVSGSHTDVIISHHSPMQTYNPMLAKADTLLGSFGRVRSIVSVSRSVERSLNGKPLAYRRKRSTIRNALSPCVRSQLEMLRTRRAKTRGRRIIALGRLAPQKNYPVLLEAIASVPSAELKIIGGGPDEGMLRDLAMRLGIADRVEFIGQCPRAEALSLLATADIFVQPSLYEGHSLALMEASLIGLPLIVSSVPVQIEGITAPDGRRCGVAVDPSDAAGMANAIALLLDDPLQHEYWAAASDHLAVSSSFQQMVGEYERLIVGQSTRPS